MIRESYPWKQDLLRRKRLIEEYNSFERFEQNGEEAYTIIEKSIFYSAFIIRKLMDCKVKISKDVDDYTLNVSLRRPLKKIDITHRWLDENSHDWENETLTSVKGRDICNWLIHSYVFSIVGNELLPCSCFCVSSDTNRNDGLYTVSIDDWVKYMDFVGTDDVVELEFRYDSKLKENICIRKVRSGV